MTTPHEGRHGSFCSDDPVAEAAAASSASVEAPASDAGLESPSRITRRGSFSALEASNPGKNPMAWVQLSHVERHVAGRGWLQPFLIPKAAVTILPFQVLTPIGG